jgi:prepilin-type N-terminal cleavage/methylation domain-containing protein/prepilin-type processing-associated H-X9-DG protein
MKTNLRGFTLVEMLVVIMIGAVLALLLVPVVLRTRENARAVVCAENLGRLGTALAVVMPEEGGRFSNVYYGTKLFQPEKWWIDVRSANAGREALLSEPVGEVIGCPSARGYMRVPVRAAGGQVAWLTASYAHNVEMPLIAGALSRVRDPANRVIFYDGAPAAVLGLWEHTPTWPDATIIRRHLDSANFLFLDGHVERRGAFGAELFHGCPSPSKAALTGLPASEEKEGEWDPFLGLTVTIRTESNNVRNEGTYIHCVLTFGPEIGDGVDPSSVYLLGTSAVGFENPVPMVPPMLTSIDPQGRLVCKVRFDRGQLYGELEKANQLGQEVSIRVVGVMTNGRPFSGADANAYFLPSGLN